MTVPPEISSQSELLLETTGATRPGQAPEAQVCQVASSSDFKLSLLLSSFHDILLRADSSLRDPGG